MTVLAEPRTPATAPTEQLHRPRLALEEFVYDDHAVRQFLQAHGIGYPSLVDVPGPADAGVRLGNPAGVLPYSVLVAADGRILKTRIGPFADRAEIAAWALQSLQEGL